MFQKFNSWVINQTKEAHTSFNRREDLGALLSFLTATLLVLILEILGSTFVSQTVCTLIEVFLLASLIIVMGQHTLTPAQALGCWLHYILLYKKEERQREIDLFLNQHEREKFVLEERTSFLGMEKFLTLNKSSLPLWCRTNLSKHKTIIKLINERCLGTKEFRTALLYWSQIIPKQKLSVEGLKLLMLINPLKNKDALVSLDPISCDEIETIFKHYSEQEIKRLFTSSFYLQHYIEVLNISKEHSLELPVKKDMLDLLFWVKEMSAAIKGEEFIFQRHHSWINELEDAETSLGEVVYIDNAAKLDYWAIAMNNCLKSQKSFCLRAETFHFGVYRDGKPYLVFQLHHTGHLREAKKKANQALHDFESKALTELLKSVFKRNFNP